MDEHSWEVDDAAVEVMATSPTPWLTSTPRQSSTASPASIPSEQRRSTGARMASGRLFIATEVRYRNACHDWRLRASEPLQQLRSGR